MWFKNLRLYALTEPWDILPEDLCLKLSDFKFNPCGSLDPMRYGFVSPLGADGKDFLHVTNGYVMICAKKQEKILPGGVIKEQLEEKVRAIIEAESRAVSRKERDTLKDEIIFSLLPKAFTKSSLDYAYIDRQGGLIVVNASSAKRAEDLLSKLREALGSLRCLPIAVKNIPTQVMTRWLWLSEAPMGFELGDEVELQSSKDGRVIKAKRQDLTASEILNHLESGMYVSKISLVWRESISFIVDDQAGIKRLKFDDVISDNANDRNPDSKVEQFDADFAIMAMELKNMLSALFAAFGGISDETAI